jgi:hypothetical protein
MVAGRGFATAVCLIVIALTCIAFAKRIERERRLLRKLRENGTISFDGLTDDERDTAESLSHAGVLRKDRDRGYVHPEGLRNFKRKRIRLAVSGAAGALLLALILAFILLR